ncbi:MAG: serine protease, partial [Pseudomonadota bacterium]
MKSIAVTQPIVQHPLRALWMLAMGIIFLLAQTLMAAAQTIPGSFAELAERISPSVVNITTSTVVARNTSEGMPRGLVPEGSPFEDFFREFQDRRNNGNNAPRRSSAL